MADNSLTNITPANSYKDLLHTNNSNEGIGSTLRSLYTGAGEKTNIKLSQNQVEIDCNNGQIIKPNIKAFTNTFVDIGLKDPSLGGSDSNISINLNSGNVFKVSFNSSATLPTVIFNLTVSNNASNAVSDFMLIIDKQDIFTYNSTSFSWFSSSIKWGAGNDPFDDIFNNAGTDSTNLIGEHILRFMSPDGGATWYGWIVDIFFSTA